MKQYKLTIKTFAVEEILFCNDEVKERVISSLAKCPDLELINVSKLSKKSKTLEVNNCYFKIFSDGRVCLKQELLNQEISCVLCDVNYVSIRNYETKKLIISIELNNGKLLEYTRFLGSETMQWVR
jgi:hypothetical protein